MATSISRDDVRRLLGEGAHLVEVLPRNEYEEDHLPGALNIPLAQIDTQATKLLKGDRPIIVYCWDTA